MSTDPSSRLRHLPSTDLLLESTVVKELIEKYPRAIVVGSIRKVLDGVRRELLAGGGPDPDRISSPETYVESIAGEVARYMRPSLRRVVNATGIVIHTNLGRAPIAPEAFDHARMIAERYSNLEYDLEDGKRGSRHDHVSRLLCHLTGAEMALAVNNCAAALLTTLHAVARGREVIVSRGELIEIGGSFRLPEIMEASGAKLVEVGTTNRTHLDDYRRALKPETGAILKVHLSNFRQEGFTAKVDTGELAEVAREAGIPLLYDLGSGAFLPVGEGGEPPVASELRAGPDVIMMSGDKLLGSVQAGLIVGRRETVEKIRSCPVLRAVRPGKVTIALLEATLLRYLDEPRAREQIPVLRLISRPFRDIREDADALRDQLLARDGLQVDIEITEGESEAGGGAIGQPPMATILLGLVFDGIRPEDIARRLRMQDPPVIVRVRNDKVWIDPRTIFADELGLVADAIAEAAQAARS